jgi:uncharacterized repeat protein (TIGR01451 family)
MEREAVSPHRSAASARRARLGAAALVLTLAAGSPAAAIQLQSIATGLSAPVAVANAGDGSGRLFIVEQPGVIRIYDGTQVLPTPFLDITGLVSGGGERGLLGLAFHPGYPTTPFFYVNYTCAPGTPSCAAEGDTVIARFQVSADPNVADPSSEVVVLTVGQPEDNHNGGQLNFGPNDGYLYIALGDGGGAGDDHGPIGNGQNTAVLLGKILRIDVDNVQPPLNYGIPPTNPFVNMPPAREEIWAYGLRNPWRFSFDRATGDLFLGDVGQACYEEVDFQPAASGGGENYGWRVMEATHCFDFSNFGNCAFTGCSSAGLTLPILEYEGALGNCSEIAGYRYRGAAIPSLVGTFVDADFCGGQIRGAVESGGTWTSSVILPANFAISTFGEDEAGELYVADYTAGAIHRIVDFAPADVSLVKTDSVDPVVAGDTVSYTLTVTNNSAGPSVGVTVTDLLPPELTYLGSSPAGICASAVGIVTCDLGTVAAGASVSFQITTAVRLSASGTIVNNATVFTGNPDPDPGNNDATADTTVLAGDTGLVELTHGAAQVYDLAALSPTTADQDFYVIGQRPKASYEIVVDAASGDLGPGLQLQRVDGDAVTVLQSAAPVSAALDMSQSLRWVNTATAEVDGQFVRVRSGGCSTDCGPDDVYRIRAFETTYSIPRFNNAGTQVTVLLLQNPGGYAIAGEVDFWSVTGTLLGSQSFSLGPRATLVLNTASVPGAAGAGGTLTVASDGRYGDLTGKTVALEPSTGFSFDSPMAPRPR